MYTIKAMGYYGYTYGGPPTGAYSNQAASSYRAQDLMVGLIQVRLGNQSINQFNVSNNVKSLRIYSM